MIQNAWHAYFIPIYTAIVSCKIDVMKHGKQVKQYALSHVNF